MVRIHSPRPNISISITELRRLKPLRFQRLFRFCAQNCAHPTHLAPADLQAGPKTCTSGRLANHFVESRMGASTDA